MIFSVVGQVGGLAIASAVFQSRLNTELHSRLSGESEEVSFGWQTFFFIHEILTLRSLSRKSDTPLGLLEV